MVAPLQGKEILITREKSKSKIFAELVKEFGGIPIEIPLLSIRCKRPDKELHLSNYQWIIFTSANGVDCFFGGLNKAIHDSTQIAVVGHKTEKALHQFGARANFIPSVYNAETMALEFLEQVTINGPILIVKGNKSRQVLQKTFSKNGIVFDELETYATTTNRSAKPLLSTYFNQSFPDFITFTSPSTVEGFIELSRNSNYVKNAQKIPCMCIGTTTEERAKDLGFVQTMIPNQFTTQGMIEKMARYVFQHLPNGKAHRL